MANVPAIDPDDPAAQRRVRRTAKEAVAAQHEVEEERVADQLIDEIDG